MTVRGQCQYLKLGVIYSDMKKIILILITLLLPAKDAFCIDLVEHTLLTTQSDREAKINAKATFDEYISKLKQITQDKDLNWGIALSSLFYNKININKLDELKENGFDIEDLTIKWGDNFYKSKNHKRMTHMEKAIFFDVVFIGTIIRTDYFTNGEYGDFYNSGGNEYNTCISIRVDEIIKGAEYYNEVPKVFKIFFRGFPRDVIIKLKEKDSERFFRELDLSYNIGEQCIFYCEAQLQDYLIAEYTKNNVEIPDYFMRKDYFFSCWNVIKKDFITDFEKTADEIREYLSKYEEINDTPNFYRRSYK